MTRSTSSSRPISGSILPSAAALFRFWVNWSSGLSLPGLRLALLRRPRTFLRIDLLILAHAVGNEVDHVQTGHALLVQVVHRVRIFSPKMATSTLAPVTSFLPFEADCTCMIAR